MTAQPDPITPPPQCPACGYDGHEGEDDDGRVFSEGPSATSQIEHGACFRCGAVWYAKTTDELLEAYRVAGRDEQRRRKKAEQELRQAHERIAELVTIENLFEAVGTDLLEAVTAAHRDAARLPTIKAGFLAYQRYVKDKWLSENASEAIRAAAKLCEPTPERNTERCPICSKTMEVMPGDSEAYCSTCGVRQGDERWTAAWKACEPTPERGEGESDG